MTTSDPGPKSVSRRTFMQLGSAVPLGLALPGSSWASPFAEPAEPYLQTRDKVGDPETVVFTVQYPGKAPLKLVGYLWSSNTSVKQRQACPAIVEFNPYRRRDGTMGFDSKMYPWFAYNDYLCLRIDLQGSGDSEGVMSDEYSDEEQVYCTQVIDQIARHPRCNGHVGMMGISWSAINTLMVAARSDCPKALKAVVVCSGTDDRYEDDVHYMGGAMLYDNATWPTFMWRWLALPPDPAVVGDAWQAMWRERIQRADFWFKPWASHQKRDDYWTKSSVRGHYERIKVPVFVVSGWQDAYKNQVGRLLAGLTQAGVPARGMLGPWGHQYPFLGSPGPQLDWLQHLVTHWWDPWLKGKAAPTSPQWPQLLVWLGESQEPNESSCGDTAGRWVAEDAQWQARVDERSFYLGAEHRLAAQPAAGAYAVPSHLVINAAMLETGSLGACGDDDLPGDQTVGDLQSLVFDSDPLAADLDCFGQPQVTVTITCNTPKAVLAIRLCEISPTTGMSHLVTFRCFNLCQRSGDLAKPQLIEPGTPFTVKLQLNTLGHTFKAGWRLRLALSSSLFPAIWPGTSEAAIRIHSGSCAACPAASLVLPRRVARRVDLAMPELLATETRGRYVNSEDYVPTLEIERPPHIIRQVAPTMDGEQAGVEMTKSTDFGRVLLGGPLDGLWVDHRVEESCQVSFDEPRSMTAETAATSILERPSTGWKITAVTKTKIWTEEKSPGRDVFRYTATIKTYLANAKGVDEAFEEKRVDGEVPRTWI